MKQGEFCNHYDIAKPAKVGFVLFFFVGLLQFLLTKDVTQSHTTQSNTGLAIPSLSSREKARTQMGLTPERG